MKILTSLFLVVVIITVIVSGCTSPQQTVTSTPAATPIATPVATTSAPPAVPESLIQTWIVTTMGIQDGTAITYPTTQISLTFNQDWTLGGYGGCNNYNGPFSVTGQTSPKGLGMTVGPLVSTKKFCAAYSQQENMYLGILQDAMSYDVNVNKLVITGRTGNTLVYQTQASLLTPTPLPQPI